MGTVELDSGLVAVRSTFGREPATASVGPDYRPGDPNGIVIVDEGTAAPPVRPTVQPWDGWPAEWPTPAWQRTETLVDVAWACLDLNSSILATMPPYLVGAAPSLDASWLANPNPDLYASWADFAKGLFWDYQSGEAFVVADSYYETGRPARFHVVPAWAVDVDWVDGRRHYAIGSEDVTRDILHIRYQSPVDSLRGTGPLELAGARLVASRVLARTAAAIAGGIPPAVLLAPGNLTAERAAELQRQWIAARSSTVGEPAVLAGGLDFRPMQLSAKDLAWLELAQFTDARICVLLGVLPWMLALPSGGDSLTYSTLQMNLSHHWRAYLSPRASFVCQALSRWLLPGSTVLELNRDEYVKDAPLERAQYYEIMQRIGVLTAEQIQQLERIAATTSAPPAIAAEGIAA